VRSRRLLAAAATFALGALGIVPAADGASIHFTPACYHSQDPGLLTGAGFLPRTHWTARIGGLTQLGSGTTDALGRVRASFVAPSLRTTLGEQRFVVSLSDGPHVASSAFLVTPLGASFAPSQGDPATMRVRFRVLGLGHGHNVYIHYIRPDHRLRLTRRIGVTSGSCGHLRTRLLRLFPFRAERGLWGLQIDTRYGYRSTTAPRLQIHFRIS
jgi:hypothetical protein